MSLTQQILDLITRTGTEVKSIRAAIGNLASLSTTEKGSLVGALNEVAASSGAGPIDADDITDATTTGKAVLRATDPTTARGAIGAGTSNLTLGTTGTTAKAGNWTPAAADITDSTTLGRAVLTAANAAAARLSLDVPSTADTAAAITAELDALVAGAPGTLDTLTEIAAALGNNPDAITEILAALGNRVRVDAAQTLDATQRATARTNIDVYSKAEIGDITTDFVAAFNAAIA
ncbi:hypothetical protein [Nocardia sp. NPDC057455]|uniref:hypothetical protein n=1 Tax=Nocardia sp. NPDC057455 TaxID=3346138 RepID=UPI003673296F